MYKNDIGLIGLSVMGSNLALNIADKGYKVSIYNRTTAVTDEVLRKYNHANFEGAYSLAQLSNQLQKPRKIILMIKSGSAVDTLIEQLLPHIEPGDLLIDGGNSYFKDTKRRFEFLKQKNIHYIGLGVSGGEEGARFGPALMPGGEPEAYKQIQDICESIAAKVDGEACCNYISSDGSGHYVKMIHNAIEYADMQLISEAYMLLKHVGRLNNTELHEVFKCWNQAELESYLIKITSDIFEVKDIETGNFLVDMILDKASQKGTGKWANLEALDLSVDISTISSAVSARFMSNLKQERINASKLLLPKTTATAIDKETLIQAVRQGLYSSKIACYAQGFNLLKVAAQTYHWNINYANIAKIFRGGCIIQARFLSDIINAYNDSNNIDNLMLADFFKDRLNDNDQSLRKAVTVAIDYAIPVPAMSSALAYIDTYRCANLGANLIQAQRDYFGAHTFERIDKDGIFHHNWVTHHE